MTLSMRSCPGCGLSVPVMISRSWLLEPETMSGFTSTEASAALGGSTAASRARRSCQRHGFAA